VLFIVSQLFWNTWIANVVAIKINLKKKNKMRNNFLEEEKYFGQIASLDIVESFFLLSEVPSMLL